MCGIDPLLHVSHLPIQVLITPLYAGIFRKFKTSKKENVIVFRISVLFLGICSTLLSLSTYTIYGLWVLAGDLGFVIVFPQFFASVYFPKVPFIYYVSTLRERGGFIKSHFSYF